MGASNFNLSSSLLRSAEIACALFPENMACAAALVTSPSVSNLYSKSQHQQVVEVYIPNAPRDELIRI